MTHGPAPVAIVTGASRGIGAEVAKRLARDGFSVAVNYAANADAAQAVVAHILAANGRAAAIKADVSRSAEVASLFDQTQAQLGQPTLVVNNAGIMKLAPIAEMDDATFDAMLAVNLKGVFYMLREAARRLPRGGKIINTSTTQTRLASPSYGAYVASKAGVEMLTLILARELRGRGVTVNAVAPGPTATELFLDGKSPEIVDRIAGLSPLERLGTPEDIAGVVSMIAGHDGDWINGQTIFVNGGAA
ncbi:SDR family oxidoreductase [Acidibrevibacterium fodinaquatile]|uniref:SDR family oxidoreductase n=1 Tax=Acidibrevibacterium fodinaquatile TaxID=1969806 RepID=UPI000E0DF946|nr:SDR family oxidoreductase [Acidibrevibacterium fodinaquatile]